MKERYQNMMDQMKLSDAGRAAIEEKLTQPITARRRFPLRAALAAACMVLALVGGALAIGQLANVSVVDPETGVDHSGYDVSIDLGETEEKTFSEAILADCTAGTLRLAFDSRAELENYLGFSLVRSELLENAGIVETLEQDFAHGWDLRPELKRASDARYVLTGWSYDGTEMATDPQVLKITTSRVVNNFEVYLDARILTREVTGEVVLSGEDFAPEKGVYVSALITDESGEPTWEPVYYESAEKDFTFETFLMPCGIEATIVTVETVDPKQQLYEDAGIPTHGRGFCDFIAYFVYDGVLYTVRPYAIYDNTVTGSLSNGYELTIIRQILNSFA